MPERTSYTHGTPSWVDLGSPDTAASAEFYTGLFGWDYAAAPEPEAGGYGLFSQNGKNVAGMGPLQDPDDPPAWSTYITVDDIEATTAAVTAAGGQVIMPEMQVMDAGSMAIFSDTVGAFFLVWKPGESIGSELVNEPVSLCWNEHNSRDAAAVMPFYRDVFGWEFVEQPMSDGAIYNEIHVGGEPVAGAMVLPDEVPDEVPPHWLAYFAVADCAATVAAASAAGGTVMMEPMAIDPGVMALLLDPHGAVFGILELAEPQ